MGYLASHRGDGYGAHQGGFGLALLGKSLLGKFAGKALGWAGRRISKGALGKGVAAGAAAYGVGRALGVPRMPHVGVPMPGGGTFRPTALLPGGTPAFTPGQIPKGYRLNKSGYTTRDGTYHPPGTKLVKIRSRNFANDKALRRAISRAQGFDRLVKRNRKALRSLSRI